MRPSDTPNAHPQTVLREEFDDYAVLFQPIFGEAVALDQVGVAIWKLLDGRRTLAQVAAEIEARCEDAPDTVLEDTLAFAKELHRRLFIVSSPEEIADWRGQESVQEPSPTRSTPIPPHDQFIPHPSSFILHPPSFILSLADGTCLTLCAADETAATVVSFLAEAAQLVPAPSPPPPGARRLLAVTGVDVGQVGQDGILPNRRPRYVSPVPASDADVICVLEPTDAKQARRREPDEAVPEPGRRYGPRFALEPLTEEQWLWQQLVRLSAAVARETHARGGVMLHSGLALTPPPTPSPLPNVGEGRGQGPSASSGHGILLAGASPPDFGGGLRGGHRASPPDFGGGLRGGHRASLPDFGGGLRGGQGILLAGPSGVGKTTASLRLPQPWRSLADDVTLVVRDGDGTYLAHPWPTWSRLIGEEAWEEGYSWDVQQAVPLRAIFFLGQGDEDRVEPLRAGHAVCALTELAQQTSQYFLMGMELEEIAAFHLQRFENLCALVQALPAYLLLVSLHGAFWQEMERVIR